MRIADTAFVIATVSEASRDQAPWPRRKYAGRQTRRKQRVAYGCATASPPQRF